MEQKSENHGVRWIAVSGRANAPSRHAWFTIVKQSTTLLAITVLGAVALPDMARGERLRPAPRVENPPDVLWRHPGDLRDRDLFYGSGGKGRRPAGRFTFVKEDTGGSSPKFIVRDQYGAEWKAKLGAEARAETAAARLLWSVGYITDEDYLVPRMRIANLKTLQRGQRYVGADGSVVNVRLERSPRDAKKIGSWSWQTNPFQGTRELGGLRVMMALLNNWDLKGSNTAIYDVEDGGRRRLWYAVADVGATFGTTSYRIPSGKSNVNAYARSGFITKVTPEYVSFATPSTSPLLSFFALPHMIHSLARVPMRWIGREIPREDARWISRYLSRLSSRQIRSAFEAAGYSPAEVEGFAAAFEVRIGELSEL